MSTLLILFFIFTNWEECSGIFLIGSRMKEGEFPWLIQFKTITPCGGVLVSPDWVLTAAQCAQTNRQSILLQAVGLNGSGSLQVIRVLQAYIHPEYKVQFHDHDHNIALIKLVEPFDLCDSKVNFMDIAPIRLDENYKSCLIFGWQSYLGPSSKVFAKPIQYSQVVMNAWKYCVYMHKGNESLSNVFCAMVEADGEMKACAGNPGSPIVCKNQEHRMVLLGIASWTKFSLDCGGLPSYLSVSIFRSWIYELVINVKGIEERPKTQIRSADCKNEPKGGIFEGNFQNITQLLESKKQFDTVAVSEILEKAQKLNLMLQLENDSSKKVTEQSIISHTPINESLIFDNVDDYKMILNHADEFMIGNIKERERNLREYQEIGSNRDDIESIGSSAEHSKPKYVKKSSAEIKEELTEKIQTSADFDDLLPFNFEEYRSSAFVAPFFSKYILIFYLSFLYILCR